MKNGNLGFGLMRLPQRSADPTDIDTKQLNKMVDTFLQAGFTYFDTSWAYHNGSSEAAVRECLVKRHPRDNFLLANKLPTFAITKESEIEDIFQLQLDRCGVEYFDYYLLHNVNSMRYRQIIQETHMFDHMKKWKEAGKIRHIALSKILHVNDSELLQLAKGWGNFKFYRGIIWCLRNSSLQFLPGNEKHLPGISKTFSNILKTPSAETTT